MKSMDELIDEIRRIAAGSPDAEEGEGEARDEVAVRPEEFDLEIKVDLEIEGEEAEGSDEGSSGLFAATAPLVVPEDEAPQEETEEAPEQEPKPKRPQEPPRTSGGRRLRTVALVTLAAVVIAAGVLGALWLGIRRGGGDAEGSASGAGAPLDRDVVAWAVWDEATESAFVMVFASGGDRDPVALGIPAYTVVSIPGYGLATVGDAVAVGDPGLGSAAVENLLGVRVDAWAASSFQDVAAIVDAVGGVDANEQTMDGEQAVRYIALADQDESSDEFRFLNWLEVNGSILQKVDGRAEVLSPLPPEVAAVIVSAGGAGADILELPVQDIGANLARPDTEAVEQIVIQRFGGVGEGVRLVVLNGVGTPGVGERIGRVLVPEGFRLVSSSNAERFNVEETRIIASSQEFIDAARHAQALLGVGDVYLGEQPTGVADVTVIVGRDFVGSLSGGG